MNSGFKKLKCSLRLNLRREAVEERVQYSFAVKDRTAQNYVLQASLGARLGLESPGHAIFLEAQKVDLNTHPLDGFA